MQQLKNKIRLVTFIPLTVHNGDADASLEGDAIDTKNGESQTFDSALVTAVIGEVGADVDVATVTIQEDDASDFSSPTTAQGGEAVDVVAGDLTQSFQILRSKRYLRALLTIEESGAGDDVEIAVTGVLANWSKPFPIIS